MEVKSKATQQKVSQKNRSKFYFFIIAVVALLFTNVYFYIKFKSSGEKLYTIALQKEELQREIDRAEAELDNIRNFNAESFPVELVKDEVSIRRTITDLRLQLDNTNINDQQIEHVKDLIHRLKNRITVIKDESNELRLQNELLKRENELLNSKVEAKTSEVKVLKENNNDLNQKVSTASSIKVSNISVNGVEKNRKGLYENETRAKRVDELQIRFNIADNVLAPAGKKEVFVRIVDPQGNLIADSSNLFYAQGGTKLQYTFKETISFTNKGEEYEFYWSDTNKFKKGAYTVLLYADQSIMGRSSVVLK